jgi:hypothetical protein
LVKLRYYWNDSRWHKRGIQFCKFTFTWLLFPGSSILFSSLLSLDFCSQGQVFYIHLTSVPRVKYFTLRFTFTWFLFPGSSILVRLFEDFFLA